MSTCRMGGPIRAGRRAVWAGIAAFGLFGAVGCQVEYAGMTLPTGKYLYDDVQYFAEGPHFPLANTLAATQRAQMQAQGIEPLGAPPAAGMVPTQPLGVTPPPGVAAPGALIAPGGPGMLPGAQGVVPGGAPMPAPAPGMMQPEMVPPPGPGF